jgi:putative membrane protein
MTGIPGTARSHRALILMVAVVALVLVWSGIGPRDRVVWWLEVAPVLIIVPLLIATAARFPLTPLLYALIGVHAAILMLGGHYTYARVPLGFWVQDLFDLSRNHYDRLGHFAQGFVPAIAVREVLLRTSPLTGSRWLPTLVVASCLAISACYEFLEWWIALIAGVAADEFLATQGDVWDTQWDMFLAVMGAVVALATLSRTHDRALARLLLQR